MTEPTTEVELSHDERTGRILDSAILALLNTGDTPLNVHDTDVDVDEQNKVVTVALPYVVYLPSDPIDLDDTYSGDNTAGELEFDLMYVGVDRNQAKAVAARADQRIRRRRPRVDAGLIRKIGSQRMQADPTYTAPGGAPLFFGINQYAVTF